MTDNEAGKKYPPPNIKDINSIYQETELTDAEADELEQLLASGKGKPIVAIRRLPESLEPLNWYKEDEVIKLVQRGLLDGGEGVSDFTPWITKHLNLAFEKGRQIGRGELEAANSPDLRGPSQEWLLKMADAEDASRSLSVGGNLIFGMLIADCVDSQEKEPESLSPDLRGLVEKWRQQQNIDESIEGRETYERCADELEAALGEGERGLPVDEAWLMSVGFKKDDHGDLWLHHGGGSSRIGLQNGALMMMPMIAITTRSEVLDLLRVLRPSE